MNRIHLYCLFIMAILLAACNKEADISPNVDGSMIKLIPGDRDEIPVSLSLLNNGDYLIVSNSSSLVDGLSFSKIRVIRMMADGQLLFDKYFPEDNTVSWSAKTAHLIDNEIIIGGNSANNNMLFLKLGETGDSIQFNTNYTNNPFYLDCKVGGANVFVMTTDRANSMDIQNFSPIDLSIGTGSSKSFTVDTVPASSLLLRGDTVAFATKQTINYSSLQADQDLDEDARLKTIANAKNHKIKFLLNTPENNTALALGEVSVGANSKWFSLLSDVQKNSGEAITTLYDSNIAFNDIMHNVQVEEDHILICGSRVQGNLSNSNFLLMKLDHSGRFQFSRSFGSSNSNNELYHAIWDNGRIVTVGTTAFGGKQSIVLTTLSEDGKLIR